NRAHIIASMAKTLDKQFPGIPSVDFTSIPRNAVMVDVREKNERLVSTLPRAISLADFKSKHGEYAQFPIIVFDTLGQRSIPEVSNLRAQGFDAYNLHGGILAWAHAGGIFVDIAGNVTKRV